MWIELIVEGAVVVRVNLQACGLCRGAIVDGAPLFNGVKLTKRAKRQVGFVLQVRHC